MKFKLTYKLTKFSPPQEGFINEAQGIAWFQENAPQGAVLISCQRINEEAASKLRNLQTDVHFWRKK